MIGMAWSHVTLEDLLHVDLRAASFITFWHCEDACSFRPELCGSLACLLPADELHTQAAAACRREAALEAQLQQLMQELQHERVEHAAALHASGEECRAAQGETARVKADLRQVERRHQAQAGQLEEAEAAWHVRSLSRGCSQHAAL